MRWLVVVLLLVIVGWFAWVYRQIEATANIDNAQPADAIAVFGAAEYAGRPSPVLHARLDKAVSLYDEGMAPVMITLGGGADKDSGKTEGGRGAGLPAGQWRAVRQDHCGDEVARHRSSR